eukprot:TRINITY_DN8236_c0_g1_i1.p1 TRINITY_DN8236_c0_g1~~TRINITY_DN8236_c0_g1_i1.p1  ORF type:complete len:343 (+),score=97.46 TRINITY_DN8236_c0_g1_i1:24-1031(+)
MSEADILAAFNKVTSGTADNVWVTPYSAPAKSDVNQFIFFLKPEVTDKGVHVDKVLSLALKTLKDAGVEFGATRVLGGSYLDKHNIMVQHYGVIAKISKEGEKAISDSARENLQKNFKDLLDQGAEVLGGHEFLKKFDKFSPFSLLVLNDNVGTTRLAGGTYALKAKVMGKPHIILNPFHAYQVVPYTTPGNAIVVIEGRSTFAWEDLRTKLTGTTDPATAAPGSIRRALLDNKESLGLKDVDKGSNGIHLSAGPLEGMVELQRFFTDHDGGKAVAASETAFGAYLTSKGFSAEAVNKLIDNVDVDHNGKKVSVFDLTEEKSFDVAGDILSKFTF